MSRKIVKLLALVCALVLALSGCNLIRVDEEMDAAEVVAKFNGGVVTKGEVMPEYESTLDYYNYLSSYYGYAFPTDGLLEEVVNNLVQRKLLLAKAEELGFAALTEEEKAEVAETASAEYEDTVQYYWAEFATEGLTDEQVRAEVEAFLAENEYTLELVEAARAEDKVIAKLQESVYATVVVSPEDVKAEYDAMVAADETRYADLYTFESTVTTGGYTIAWYPEGYRTVKHILLSFNEEQMTELATIDGQIADINDQIAALEEGASSDDLQAQIAQLQADKDEKLAAYVAEKQAVIDEIYARLEAGDDFQTLIDEYNEDPGMQREPAMSEGYYVCAESTSWVHAFRDGAMALEKIGDVSEPVAANYGIHIICYNSDVTAGAVPFEQMKEAAEESVTAKMNQTAFAEQLSVWVDEANITVDLSVIEE